MAAATASAAAKPFIDRFATIKTISSAVPASGQAKGDQNPYGVAVVPRTTGKLVRGDVLVSNFNDAHNDQGTGSSIVEISPGGKMQVFAVVPQAPGDPAVGLTTALVALRDGDVIVGNLPAAGGSLEHGGPGALTVLDPTGKVIERITAGDINGPWDMTAVDRGASAVLFVTNVLNGTVAAGGHNVNQGTVVRIGLRLNGGSAPSVTSNQVIADGFTEHTDPNALVVGPTGVGLGRGDVLYVADSANNRIAAIPAALKRSIVLGGGGKTVASGMPLSDPLGLTIAPNGDVLSMNGGDGNIVETTPAGKTSSRTLMPNGGGDLFGLALVPGARGLYYVNDSGSGSASNSLQTLQR
jgi:sugar lactone lactonase YvrE